MMDITFEAAIKNAAALKGLGQTRIYLSDKNPPWHIAQTCEPGSSHRLDISTDARFTGEQDGLTFSWSFSIEPWEANGTGTYQIDVAACREVLGKLHGEALIQFRSYLSDCASKVAAKGAEVQTYADRQFKDAAILRDLVNFQGAA